MEFRQLGGSGFKVPVLCLSTGTFGAKNESFRAFGASDVQEATRLVDVSLETGLNMFDSADVYSNGAAEEVLGQAGLSLLASARFRGAQSIADISVEIEPAWILCFT